MEGGEAPALTLMVTRARGDRRRAPHWRAVPCASVGTWKQQQLLWDSAVLCLCRRCCFCVRVYALHCWAWRRVPNGRRGDGRAAGRAFRQVMGIYGGSADALVMALLRRRVASRSCGARDEHGHRAELPPVARERTIMRGVPACVEG